MLSELESLQTQNRQVAREAFLAAAWEGRAAKELLALAAEAGLTGAEGDALLAKVGQAKEHLAHVEQLPRLRKDAAAANAHFKKVQTRATAEIAKLERQVQDAGYEAETAEKAVNAAADSARQLLALHDEGVLPAGEVPDEVHDLIERRDAEEHFHQVDTARVDASNERNRWRSTVRAIEERLANMPITLSSREDESALRERLKNARRQLEEAEKALKKAEAASEAARKAIP